MRRMVGFAAGARRGRTGRAACAMPALALVQGGIDAIATAHTANDQAEPAAAAAGAGHRAARCGQASGQGAGATCGRCCLDPAETEAVCRAAGQPWVTDETNDDRCLRPQPSASALPALESTNGGSAESGRFCEKAARVDAYFAAGGCEAAGGGTPGAEPAWQRTPLQAADPLLLETAMHSLTAPVRDAEEKYMQLLCAVVRQGSGAVQLTGQVRFCAEGRLSGRKYCRTRCPAAGERRRQPALSAGKNRPEFLLARGWKGKRAVNS